MCNNTKEMTYWTWNSKLLLFCNEYVALFKVHGQYTAVASDAGRMLGSSLLRCYWYLALWKMQHIFWSREAFYIWKLHFFLTAFLNLSFSVSLKSLHSLIIKRQFSLQKEPTGLILVRYMRTLIFWKTCRSCSSSMLEEIS